jgi:hypothetical protein
MDRLPRFRGLLPLLLVLGLAAPARAILIYGDPNAATGRNLSAPTGSLANSGWQDVGHWQNGGGVAIAPNYFLTAAHLGGKVGDSFTLNGVKYAATAKTQIAGTDLEVVKVDGILPNYATLYTGTNEAGQDLVTYGYGADRGSQVTLDNTLKGWNWGSTGAGVESWGTGTIQDVGPILANVTSPPYTADVIDFPFLPTSHDSGIYSTGDSGGGVFIKVGNTWQLAGINYAVDNGVYQFNSATNKYDLVQPVALFDLTGFYGYDPSTKTYFPLTSDYAFFSYATRVSTYAGQILSIVPEPSSVALMACGGLVLGLAARRRSRRAA